MALVVALAFLFFHDDIIYWLILFLLWFVGSLGWSMCAPNGC